MNRQGKQNIVASLKKRFAESEAAFLIGVEGLSIGQFETLRKGLRQHSGKLQVAKNTLLRLAVKDVESSHTLTPYFKKQVAVVFVNKDSTAVAKLLLNLSREHERLELLAGCFESRLLSKEMVHFLATLPSREQLIAQACGVIKSPLVRHVGLMSQLLVRFVWVLKQISQKQQV